MIINKKFIALPKEYRYPEHLEDGLFWDDDDIKVRILLERGVVEVYVTGFERKNIYRSDVEVTKFITTQSKFTFSLDDYIIFVDGVMV